MRKLDRDRLQHAGHRRHAVLTDSELVRAHRKAMLQFMMLNHPVDCGICDKAGECTLQDYHYEYNGEPSISRDAKVHATKLHDSRSASCSTTSAASCARAACASRTRSRSRTRSASRTAATPRSCARPRTARFDDDPYSDNVIDICPVGALLSRDFLYKARVWYLQAHAVGLPGLRARLHRRPGTASRSGSSTRSTRAQNAASSA